MSASADPLKNDPSLDVHPELKRFISACLEFRNQCQEKAKKNSTFDEKVTNVNEIIQIAGMMVKPNPGATEYGIELYNGQINGVYTSLAAKFFSHAENLSKDGATTLFFKSDTQKLVTKMRNELYTAGKNLGFEKAKIEEIEKEQKHALDKSKHSPAP